MDDSGTVHGKSEEAANGVYFAAVQSELADETEFGKGCKLLLLVARGDEKGVKSFIKDEPQLVNFRDYDRRTPLHVAAAEGHRLIVSLLISKRARLNRSDRWGGSPLDDALRHRHLEVAAVLREAGGRGGVRDHKAALITAAAAGDENEVRALLDDGANANCADYDKRTPLHLAAGENHLKVVELLLKHGASATAADRWGHTPVDDALAPRKPGLLDVPLSADEDNEAIIAVLKAAGGAAKTTAASSRAEATAKAMDMSSSKGGKAAAAARQAAADAGLFVDLKEVELEVRLGGGSFGDVYKAKWKQTPVAAKCLRATGPERRQALADFHVEAGILRHLRHPNICLLLAYSTEPGKEVMVSELMRCSLLDVLRTANLHDRPIGKRRGLRYLQELARGMHYLHTQDPPVLHRDLKPANLLIDAAGSIRVADFGLATLRRPAAVAANTSHKNMEGASSASTRGASASRGALAAAGPVGDAAAVDEPFVDLTGLTGSFRFMAPEVYCEKPYGRPVDVYSFAMIAYNILESRAPWADLAGEKAVQLACAGDRPPVPRSYDKRLAALLGDAWRAEPKARPSFAALLDQLAEFEAEGEVEPPLDATKAVQACCVLS